MLIVANVKCPRKMQDSPARAVLCFRMVQNPLKVLLIVVDSGTVLKLDPEVVIFVSELLGTVSDIQ